MRGIFHSEISSGQTINTASLYDGVNIVVRFQLRLRSLMFKVGSVILDFDLSLLLHFYEAPICVPYERRGETIYPRLNKI